MDKRIDAVMEYVLIVVGALIASFSVICILIPNDAIDYGTAGIAIIMSILTGINLSLCVWIVFIPFLILGLIVLGKRFFSKALVGTIAYSAGLEYFEAIPFELDTEHFLAVAFGGALLGVGLALILRYGGCIDGSEIFANIVLKKVSDKTGKNFSMSTILILFNVCVYTAVFVLINRNSAMMSLLVYAVATMVVDHFTDHYESVKQVTMITGNPEALIEDIRNELNKTCTVMDSEGAIAGKNKTVICYINYLELQKMKDVISRNKGTFSIVTTVDEILR